MHYGTPTKRSVTIAGHETSISLEPAFWAALEQAADDDGLPLNAFIARIDAERIEAALGHGEPAAREDGRPLRQIEPAREVIALGVQHARAQLVVAIELAVREAQGVPQRQVERVALGGAIEADEEHVAAALEPDPAFGHGGTVPHARQRSAPSSNVRA